MSHSFFSSRISQGLMGALALSLTGVITACGVSSGVSHLDSDTTPQPMRVQFAPEVNGAPFRCGTSYDGVGSTQSTLTPKDFRFYIHNVNLVNAAGETVPMTLDQDSRWQLEQLALMDFEDKTGACESGTPDTHMELTGTVPAGEYKGLSFELGVPFDMNHQDVTKAASPLNLTSMFWVWRSGYKFARIDFATTGVPQGYFIHLGSTGCTGMASDANAQSDVQPEMAMADMSHSADTPAMGEHTMQVKAETAHDMGSESRTTPPMQCSQPNRSQIVLSDFNPDTDVVVADLGQMLKDVNIDTNVADTPSGCMSGMDDGDCRTVLPAMGVDFDGVSGEQRLFTSQAK